METFEHLKQKQRRLRDGFPEELGLRVHRAISWIGRAEKERTDTDAAFIFLWISFNAAYANETELDSTGPLSERKQFTDLIDQMVALDKRGTLHATIWEQFRGPIAQLFQNRYIYRPFWLNQMGIAGNENWERRFRNSAERFVMSVKEKNTSLVLQELFERMYTLRCQILHGGTTWNSKVNRKQLRDSTAILRSLLPAMIEIMMDNEEADWGRPFYPVVPQSRASCRQKYFTKT